MAYVKISFVRLLHNTAESGLGDIVAAATYNAYSGGNGGSAIDLTGKVKFGTADDKKGDRKSVV